MKAFLISVLLIGAMLLIPAHRTLAAPPPTASWSQQFPSTYTWSGASQYAANLVEGGYSDWRLPLRSELQSAIQGGSLPPLSAGGPFFFWTSEKQGNKYWAVKITCDSNGNVIPSQSGTTQLMLPGNFLLALGIRP